MTVKLSITAVDKIKNEQKRYAKYLQMNDAFPIGIQEMSSDGSPGTPEYICMIRDSNGEIFVEDETGKGLIVNGNETSRHAIADGDIVWLNEYIQLFFRTHALKGPELFRGGKSSKDPIILSIAKVEKEEKKEVVDYTNPVGNEIGGYYFEDVLQYGSMGIVYKGLQKSLKRPVAIKTVSPKNMNNSTMIRRFMNMANLAWRLNHPYIVQIYDTGVSPEFKMNYVVMEHVEGQTLREILKEKKRLSIEESCKYMSQLASALSFAHRQNIVHRDVNPTNIIVTKGDYIKLVGLALSKVLEADEEQVQLTAKGQAMGTMGYISPEQAKSAADVDYRTDIYSLGVIFYECLCGQLPIDSNIMKDPNKYMKALRRRPAQAPHQVNPTVPENLSKIVMHCLEPNLAKRYQKAEQLVDDLKFYTESMQLSVAQKRIRAMFPKKPEIEGYEFDVTFEPMENIGGDFYDFVPLEDGKYSIIVGDVTGHGVEAAVVMGMVKSITKLMAKNLDSPGDILEYANKELSPDMDATTFTTIGCSLLDTANKKYYYARAGHNPLIVFNESRNPSLTTFAPKGTILGVPWDLNCEVSEFDLIPGDVLVQYTDGITEAKSKDGEEYGLEKMCEVIEEHGKKGCVAVAKAIKDSIKAFSSGKAEDADDVTLLIMEVK